MIYLRTKATLLACASIMAVATPALAAPADTTTDAKDAAPQSTSADEKGQANDAGALSTSDIIVTGSRTAEAAPITASLTTTQPQSVISREYIDNAVASADFNTLIALTPGVSITGTGNGAGFSESKAVIRGFQDGEYNVTYDSIPFADTNNPTHHSTAFFPSNTIETVVVDRGPGNASQLGQATYGGNVNIYSRGVSNKQGGQLEAISGNWNTFMARAEYQTGTIDKLGGAKFVLSGQYLESDGALTYSPVASKNLFAKGVIPFGDFNTLTVMSTWNRNHYYQSDTAKGATCGSATTAAAGKLTAADAAGNALTQLTGTNCAATSDVGLYGKNFGMTNNPALASYYKYNRTDKTTDFSIIRLQSTLAEGLTLDNRVYMYGYTNNTLSGNGSISAAVAAGSVTPVYTRTAGAIVTGFSGAGTAASPYKKISGTGVQGYSKLNKYRTLGYIGQLNYDFSLGKIRAGGWYEHAATDRHLIDFNMTTSEPSFNEKFNDGTAANSALPSISIANIGYLQHSGWGQYQLFGEFEFHPIEELAITPGMKYVHFTRSIDAPINQTTRTPNFSSATWTKSLPFLTINWQAQGNWSFYGQYAQGMYVPDLSSFYSPSLTAADQATQATSLAALKPQTTTNYQVGTVWHADHVSIDVDAYAIEVNNKIAADPTIGAPGGAPSGTLVNIGKVKYKGVEGQISVMPMTGLTLFSNASYNSAKSQTTGAQIAKTPFYTAALGLFYNYHGLRLSFAQKFQGAQFAKEFDGNPNMRIYRIKPYSVGDLSLSQEVGEHFRIGMTVSNVFNNRSISSISSSITDAPKTVINGVSYQTGYGQSDAFSYLPPRSAQVDVRVKF